MTPRDAVAEPCITWSMSAPSVDRICQRAAHPRVGYRVVLRFAEVEEQLVEPHAVGYGRCAPPSGRRADRRSPGVMESMTSISPLRSATTRLDSSGMNGRAPTRRAAAVPQYFSLRARVYVPAPRLLSVTTYGPVPTPDCSSSGVLRGRRGDEDVRHQVVEHRDRTLGVEGEAGRRRAARRWATPGRTRRRRSRRPAVHLQRGRDILDPHRRAVRISDARAQAHVPLRRRDELELVGQHQSGLQVLVDLGERLADAALHRQRGVELVAACCRG